jgi:hypothetical protein
MKQDQAKKWPLSTKPLEHQYLVLNAKPWTDDGL